MIEEGRGREVEKRDLTVEMTSVSMRKKIRK